MKLGLMLEVDETFTTIWLSTRSGSSWGDDLSPLSGLFFTKTAKRLKILGNKRQYLEIGARQRHSYNGGLIGNYVWPIKWYEYQWPWVSLKVIFVVVTDKSRHACGPFGSAELLVNFWQNFYLLINLVGKSAVSIPPLHTGHPQNIQEFPPKPKKYQPFTSLAL